MSRSEEKNSFVDSTGCLARSIIGASDPVITEASTSPTNAPASAGEFALRDACRRWDSSRLFFTWSRFINRAGRKNARCRRILSGETLPARRAEV